MIVRHALLALLSEGPKYGFQLAHEFEAGTGEMWPLNTGQVYTHPPAPRARRPGRVRRRRRRRPAERLPHHRRRATTSSTSGCARHPTRRRPPRDELVIKVLVALRVPEVDAAELARSIAATRSRRCSEYTRLKEDGAEDDIGLLLVADAEIYRLEAMIRWLDAADARIKRLPMPLPEHREPNNARPRRPAQDRSTAMTRRMLELSNVSKSYGDGPHDRRSRSRRRPRRSNAGELVAIMGPSGSGKSTLLTIAGTLEEATTGEVTIDGQSTCRRCRATTGPACAAGRSGTSSRTSTCWPD